MSEPFEPQQPQWHEQNPTHQPSGQTGPWHQPPITELAPQPWDGASTTPYQPPNLYAAPGYTPPDPYAPQPGPMGPAYLAGSAWPPATSAPVPPKRGRLRWVVTAGVAALVLVGGGVSYAAYSKLNGGGTQPDAVTPANAIGFVKLDLNPSASQKVSAARFLGKVPNAGAGFSSTGDWRKSMFDLISNNNGFPSDVDFDRDVKPWLGQRMALAAVPATGDGDPTALLVVQSTDDAKAKTGIAHFDPDAGVDFYKGYALIAETQTEADSALASVQRGTLAGSSTYRTDMKAMGSLGVAAGWLDLAAIKNASSGMVGFSTLPTSGRFAFNLRFSSSSADLVAKTFGAGASKSIASDAAGALGSLPASTAAAMNLSIQPGGIDRAWKQLDESLNAGFSAPGGGDFTGMLQDEFGLDLPTDLDTLLGHNVTVALDSAGLSDDTGTPTFGVVTKGDGAAAAKVLDKLTAALDPTGTSMPLVYKSTGGGLVAASSQDYLDQLTTKSTGPTLSGVASFRAALPELTGASAAGYVNLQLIADAMRKAGAPADEVKAVAGFSALGFTANTDGSMHIRLLAH